MLYISKLFYGQSNFQLLYSCLNGCDSPWRRSRQLPLHRFKLGDRLIELRIGYILRLLVAGLLGSVRMVLARAGVQRMDGLMYLMDGLGAVPLVIMVGLVEQVGGGVQL